MHSLNLEVNNTGAALRISKGEVLDEIQQTVTWVRQNIVDSEEQDRLVRDLKHILKLVRNI